MRNLTTTLLAGAALALAPAGAAHADAGSATLPLTGSAILAAGSSTALPVLVPVIGSAAVAAGSAGIPVAPSCAPRSSADRAFLNQVHEDGDSCATDDAAIRLAHSDCNYLDTVGNTADDQIDLAENSRGTVTYPYIFLDAAITSYCSWDSLA